LHRFWSVSDGDWVETRHLRPGTELHLFSGEPMFIERIDVHEAPLADTFNLHVEENVTYFVGPGVLVHNGGPSYSFGNLRIYAGYNPKFPGKVYIGQTDDINRRQEEHRREAREKLKDPTLSAEEREFWKFKEADYLEQKNMDIERGANNDLQNRREQVSKKNLPELEKKIAADPEVKKAGLCP
jgi:predicted GIY-YIG superfamily endonuclease